MGVKLRPYEQAKKGQKIQVLEKEHGPRVAAYIRVSTEEQAEVGFSLEAQQNVITSYAAALGWEIVAWYKDEGYSAYSGERRPGFEEMMADRDGWDICVAKWLNRFWRRVSPALEWAKNMDKAGKNFATVSERIDTTTAMGRAMFQMMLVMSELESGQTAERVRAAFDTKIAKGDIELGQAAPYGYRWEGGANERTGHLVVEPKEAEDVRRIYALRLKGMSREKISKVLGWCTCTPRPKTVRVRLKSGKLKEYTYNTLRRNCTGCWRVDYILNNPAYAGYLRFQKKLVLNDHESIIDRATWEKVQGRRKRKFVVLPDASIK